MLLHEPLDVIEKAETKRSPTMRNLAYHIPRILLGLLFTLAGGSIVFLIGHPPPPMPGFAGDFMKVVFGSRFVLFTDGVQFVCGVLLLANRYVPLALTILAGILANILVFHLTMQPIGIFPGLIATILWFVMAWQIRDHFAPLLAARVTPGVGAVRTPST